MIVDDDQINEAFVRHVDRFIAAIHLAPDWTILGMTAAAASLLGKTPAELRGSGLEDTVDNAGFSDEILRAVDDGRLADDRISTRRPFKDIMKPVADEVGLCISWIWLIDPGTLRLTRSLASLRKFPDGSYTLNLSPVEDPTHRCFTRIDERGCVEDKFGAHLTREEIELIDFFMSGRSYEQIGEAFEMTSSMVKRRIHKIAEKMGAASPAEMREAIWNKHSEEFLIAPESLVPGIGESLYRKGDSGET
jgi:hypothetical protein